MSIRIITLRATKLTYKCEDPTQTQAFVRNCKRMSAFQPRSQGLSSLPPLVVGTETLVAAGHVTIYPSKTAGWVGTQVHLVERKPCCPTLPADFYTTQILGGHVTSRNQGLCSND